MGALIHRLRTGKGQYIEVPMFETMVAFVMPEHMAGRAFEPPMGEAGYARVINKDRRPFQTKDGWLCVLPYRSEEHTSELPSLMRLSYAVFCLKKKRKATLYSDEDTNRKHLMLECSCNTAAKLRR